MAMYGAFSNPVLGMMAQSRSLHNISTNISNMNTGGYKATDTQFSTLLSRSLQHLSDNGGVRPMDKATVSKQGNIVSSELATDIAISGKGFFVMNTAQDGSGGTVYGRDGSLEIKTVNDISITGNNGQTISSKDGYLVDKNGYFLQGWAYQNGTVTTTGTPTSLRVDQFAFINQFSPTTKADLGLNLPAGDDLGHANTFDISIYDSAGKMQSVQLSFTKTGVNAWDVTVTNGVVPVAQVDTVTIGGSVGEAGDVYSVSVNGNAVSYTTTGGEASLDAIRDNLILAINNDPKLKTTVTAATGASGEITLTAVNAGNALTTVVGATQGPASVAQADRVTLAGGIVAGDVYSVTVNGITLSATAGGADTLTTLRDNLLGQINANPTLAPLVTASASGVDAINLVSDTAGVAYTITAATTDAGGAPVNSNTVTAVTANYTALTDNTASFVTTVANVTNSTTSAATALTFKSDGTLASPTTMNLALSFGGTTASTATVALDISTMTQFYGDFLPRQYSKDGFASSNMKSFNFDSDGNVTGSFEDNTQRKIYQLALGVFSNPNALEAINGNVYKPSNDSGAPLITTAGASGYASITPNAHELSNVDMGNEFTKMMLTQTAYNASSTVFRTADEMLTIARDLKR